MKKIQVRNSQWWNIRHCINIRSILYILLISFLSVITTILFINIKYPKKLLLDKPIFTQFTKYNNTYLTIIDKINKTTPCKIQWTNNLTLKEIYANKNNWNNLLKQCNALKDRNISITEKNKLIKAIVKWFRITIWGNQVYRAYNLVWLKQQWLFSWNKLSWTWNKLIWTQDSKMLFYYYVFNKEFDLSKITLYIDGKQYKLTTSKSKK